ncbi:transmembrane protein 256 homolog isoform X2 [Acanthaster planci]|uniref:Transmembrane protein 256 homolog isoform X2 n=1 Tax=Acanthaster planci TaxID=133434 RepID=A0A8B7ZHD4_ACAPL|nr:transmembrane protein 256 homolog isoform X2 [Acanthaster planci]
MLRPDSTSSAVVYKVNGVLKPKADLEHEQQVFDSANKYHFLHTLALLAVPLTRRPMLVGSLMVTGMTMFCGPCYYYAMTSDPSLVKVAPYGGTLLIVAWAAMVL